MGHAAQSTARDKLEMLLGGMLDEDWAAHIMVGMTHRRLMTAFPNQFATLGEYLVGKHRGRIGEAHAVVVAGRIRVND